MIGDLIGDRLPIRIPFNRPTYGAGKPFYIDKTGVLYFVWDGRLTNPGPWGTHVYRAVPGQSLQLLYFLENSGGVLVAMNKQLWYSYSDAKGLQWRLLIDSYIDPQDTPSSDVVSVDEVALNAVKLSVTTVQGIANGADYKAARAQTAANNAQLTADRIKVQLADLQAKVDALQFQSVTEQKVADIVWAKLWDVVYLLRRGMNAGVSDDVNIRGWISDLTSFIKKVK